MRKVVVSQFVSLDGVFEDPGGAEDFEHGGWSFKFDRGDGGNKFKLDEVMGSDVLLLGRVTYEGFAAAWPDRDDKAGFAEKFNGMPKVVVSTTLKDPEWNNSTVIDGSDLEGEIAKLKEGGDGDILVNGSGQLVRALAEGDLVDEYRLMVFPVVLGTGRRVFEDLTKVTTLELADSEVVGDGVLILTYGRASG
jgi:dihydrofolate reductase